jgi:hypothetical protein
LVYSLCDEKTTLRRCQKQQEFLPAAPASQMHMCPKCFYVFAKILFPTSFANQLSPNQTCFFQYQTSHTTKENICRGTMVSNFAPCLFSDNFQFPVSYQRYHTLIIHFWIYLIVILEFLQIHTLSFENNHMLHRGKPRNEELRSGGAGPDPNYIANS